MKCPACMAMQHAEKLGLDLDCVGFAWLLGYCDALKQGWSSQAIGPAEQLRPLDLCADHSAQFVRTAQTVGLAVLVQRGALSS